MTGWWVRIALSAVWLLAAPYDARGHGAQDGATVAGQVVDGVSGVPLSDVRVQIQGQPGSVLTDAGGHFTLRGVPPGPHVLTVSVVGFVLVRRDITLGDGGQISLVIPVTEGTGTYTERVEVTGDLFRQGEAGVPAQHELGSADLQNLRGLVLDDPVRAMHILPGVTATDDLYSEFAVRGSDFSRIGLAVDGVPSRFLSHSVQGVEDGGSIGMINSDILQSVTLHNGSYPQRFGNRTGAQIEMTLREGSRDRSQVRVALSGSSASIVGEGPMGRGRKASWLVSARKSYLDLLIKQIADNETFAFGFTDLASKVVIDVTARHHLEVSALAGRAALDADQRDVGLNDPLVATNRGWLGALAWRYAPGPRLTWTQRVGVTGGEFSNRSLARVVLDEGRSTDLSARSDAVIVVHPAVTVEAGGSVHWQDERLTKRRVVNPTRPAEVREHASLDSRWVSGYALVRWTLPSGAMVGAGARVDHWDGTGQTTTSPWVNAQVRLGGFDLIGGTGLFQQFPGFNAITGLRGTPGLPAARAWHADMGVGRRLGTHMRAQAVWFHRAERNGVRLPGDEWRLVSGAPTPPATDTFYHARLDGTAQGVELLAQRRSPNGLSGWASYSVGRYEQHDLVSGERFNGDFDQRHALSLYGVYRLNDRTSLAMKLRVSSNVPVRGYFQELPASPEHPVPDDQPARYGLAEQRNGTRLPVYQRVDLRANRTWTLERSRLTLYVELMNVLGRTNWRTGNGGIRPDGEIVGLLDPLVPFVPSAGLLWEF